LPPGLPAAAVTRGSTVVVNENGLMRAVDRNSGRQLWRTRIAANVRNTIGRTLLYDGVLHFPPPRHGIEHTIHWWNWRDRHRAGARLAPTNRLRQPSRHAHPQLT
jgi:hypothetical protein